MMKGLGQKLIGLGAVACLVTAFLIVWSVGLPDRADYTGFWIEGEWYAPEAGARAPLFEAQTLAGHQFRLTDLRGQAVLVNFWATWCEPCKAEMPALQAIYEQYRERGLAVIGVNIGEGRAVIEPWVGTFGLTFDIVRDDDQQITTLYQLRGQPATYVIAPNGVITEVYYGATTERVLGAAIAPILPA